MRSWKEAAVHPTATIRETIRVIDASRMQIALVVDERDKLIGTVTDGDVRRGILNGTSLEERVTAIMNCNPTTARLSEDRAIMLGLMRQRQLHQIPILDDDGSLKGVETIDELLLEKRRENAVVLMAGGLGSRLRPLTNDQPKPLLSISGKPILEIILSHFVGYGFRTFFVSVNYKAEMIKEYFGDGSRWGARIEYLHEKERLGTAGALSLLPEGLDHPVFVMNGDIVTRVNLEGMLKFHEDNRAAATICVREFSQRIPFGVVRMQDNKLVQIEEKPLQKSFVSAGIYILEPEVLSLVPKQQYYDMPALLQAVVDGKKTAACFPIHEYWMDIGRVEDFELAHQEYVSAFT